MGQNTVQDLDSAVYNTSTSTSTFTVMHIVLPYFPMWMRGI